MIRRNPPASELIPPWPSGIAEPSGRVRGQRTRRMPPQQWELSPSWGKYRHEPRSLTDENEQRTIPSPFSRGQAWTSRIALLITPLSSCASAVAFALAKVPIGWRELPRNTVLKSACAIYWTVSHTIAFGARNREQRKGEPIAASIYRTLNTNDRAICRPVW
jgi:hypothetical protein